MSDDLDEEKEQLEEAMKEAERKNVNPERTLKKLQKAQEKIRKLKNERDELLNANQELVNIARELEDAIPDYKTTDRSKRLDNHTFSRSQNAVDIKQIDNEIEDVIETVRELKTFKNKE
jgi:predicted transcriptional regulator